MALRNRIQTPRTLLQTQRILLQTQRLSKPLPCPCEPAARRRLRGSAYVNNATITADTTADSAGASSGNALHHSGRVQWTMRPNGQ
ncbi:hypothetical protein JCM14124_06750 [Humidesulfovibrio idahonensis]